MELKIYLRQTQYFAIVDDPNSGIQQGQPIVYAGTSPSDLSPVVGTVEQDVYIDFTSYCSNLDTLSLTWSIERDGAGQSQPGAFQPQKSTSGQLSFEGEAYRFIREWLIDSISAPINSIDVKIEHVGCGEYLEYIIKANQIDWCEDEGCVFNITAQQKDEAFQCIHRTVVYDNWQGWFPTSGGIPANGKRHPRFLYCNESRPNGTMLVLWWLMAVLSTILALLSPIINTIITVINIIIALINTVSWLFGGDQIEYIEWYNPLEELQPLYLNTAGCNRVHPAPLIRDYIDNVCQRCGITIDAITDPIFHSETITIEAASGMKEGVNNPYYNACYLNAPSRRGIKLDGVGGMDSPQYWIHDNRPSALSLDMFLDQVKELFNAEWRLRSINGVPHLYFWRKDWYNVGSALYDFSDNSEDRLKILQGICYSWAERKYPAYMRGLYTTDEADSCSGEALAYMNDIVEMGDITNNPTYDGHLDKTSRYFGATRFRLDGASTDYITDAIQVMLNGTAFNPGILPVVTGTIVPAITDYADYVLLMENDTCARPKVLIWDPDSGYEKSRAIRSKTTFAPNINGSTNPLPSPNPIYNVNGFPWFYYHFPDTYVAGSQLTFAGYPPGKYTAQFYFGIDLYARPADLVNYPMFFAAGFKDNIFDWFHWIDDHRINPNLNLRWSVKIGLCCEDLEKLKLFGDASDAQLMGKVLLPVQYYGEGKITEITANYNSGDGNSVGKYIELKGIT